MCVISIRLFFFFLIEVDGGLPTIVVGSSKVVVLDNYFIIVQFRPANMQVAPGKAHGDCEVKYFGHSILVLVCNPHA